MSAQDFFRDLRAALAHTLRTRGEATHTEAVLLQAWDSFDGNVAIQSEGQPALACRKGCPSCCTLRVTATAPEVLLLAAYLRATAPVLKGHGIDLVARLHEIDAVTRGLDEAQRVALRQRCAFIVQGVCLVHRVRPLAWGAYELNHALVLALDQPDSHADWLRGGDPLAAAAVDREQRAAMAADFDSIAH